MAAARKAAAAGVAVDYLEPVATATIEADYLEPAAAATIEADYLEPTATLDGGVDYAQPVTVGADYEYGTVLQSHSNEDEPHYVEPAQYEETSAKPYSQPGASQAVYQQGGKGGGGGGGGGAAATESDGEGVRAQALNSSEAYSMRGGYAGAFTNDGVAGTSTSSASTSGVVYATPVEDGSGSALPSDVSVYLAPAVVGDDYEYAEAVVAMVKSGTSTPSSTGPVYAQYAPSNAAGRLGDGHTYAEVGGGGDYTYIDEDAPNDGHSRAAIEYATLADYTPETAYLEPAVVGAGYEDGSET